MTICQTVSIPAVRLYVVVEHLSRQWEKRHIKLPDQKIALLAGITVDLLHDAQTELERAELLTVVRMGLKTRYVLPKP
jgi:hypothetical protein